MVNSGATIALLSDVGSLTSSLTSKKGSRLFTPNVPSSIVILLRIVPILLIIAVLGVGPIVPSSDILISSIAGIFLGAGYLLYYYSLRQEMLSKTTIISEIQPIILVPFGILVLKEIPSTGVILGILLIFIGALFIITNEGLKLNRKLVPAVIGSICWAIYWLMMIYAIQGSGNFAVTVLISQIISIAMLLVYLAFNKTLKHDLSGVFNEVFKGDRKTLFAIGLIFVWALGNGFGDSVFAYVIQLKLVSLAGAANALVPILTLICAYFIYKERLTKLQYLGVVAALAGVTLITIF